MRELRPHYDDASAFCAHVDDVLRPGGYRLIGAFAHEEEHAAAVAGFRAAHSLAWGHHLYVDDLCTAAHARRRGLAGMLLEWLAGEARRLGCGQLHLDSGVGAERFDAHRFYHSHGLVISAHHFARRI